MMIGILVHSKTGHTFRFATVIRDKLMTRGYSAEITELKTDPADVSGTVREHEPFKIINLPDTSGYDVVLFGGPVWGFSASPVIIKAIKDSNLSKKKVLPFITQGLPSASLGGNHALKQMSDAANAAGAVVLPGKSAQGMLRNQEKQMDKAADEITRLF